MSEELQFEIAKRLAESIKGVEGIAGLSDYEEACESARAKEVAKLMDWARREGMNEMADDMKEHHRVIYEIDDYGYFTLPDPDWTP